MLTAIQVGNFKAFADAQRIPIRPLTLIYGANSSGKSSVIHSIVFARHALETGDLDIHRTNNRRMEWSAELDTAGFKGRLAELFAPVRKVAVTLAVGISLDDQDRPLPDAIPEVHAYEVVADGKSLLRMSKRRDGKLQLDRLDHEDPVFREVLKAIVETSTTAESIHPSDYEGLDEAITSIVPEIVTSVGRFLPEGLLRSESFTPGGQMAFFSFQGP